MPLGTNSKNYVVNIKMNVTNYLLIIIMQKMIFILLRDLVYEIEGVINEADIKVVANI